MAAVKLAPGRTFNGQELYQHARAWLPTYATPHFIRIQVSAQLGGVVEGLQLKVLSQSWSDHHCPVGHPGHHEHLQAEEVSVGARGLQRGDHW